MERHQGEVVNPATYSSTWDFNLVGPKFRAETVDPLIPVH